MAVDVRIYTTNYCGYCRAAKSLFQKLEVAFEEIDCTDDADTRRWLVDQTGQRTVPQIFIRGVPVGGFKELAALERQGKLQPILTGGEAPPSIV
jgi:glutaredoxin 3